MCRRIAAAAGAALCMAAGSRPARAVLVQLGARRVLFGSNYPMLTPRQAMDGLDALGLPHEVRAAFLHDNAARVFKLT